jgi:hypothetical protein
VAVLKAREKVVYFRISEDEFRQFFSVCEREGARSVSDLARSAVRKLIAEGDRHQNGEELASRISRLEHLIMTMTEQLRLLTTTRENEARRIEGKYSRNASIDASANSRKAGAD